jgi:hypothetical protein
MGQQKAACILPVTLKPGDGVRMNLEWNFDMIAMLFVCATCATSPASKSFSASRNDELPIRLRSP